MWSAEASSSVQKPQSAQENWNDRGDSSVQESSSLSFSRTEKKCRPRDERRLEGVICLAKWEESHLDGGKWKEATNSIKGTANVD